MIQTEPEVFTGDYVGEPGRRTFYLQARSEGAATTYLIEKEQMALLAEKLQEILLTVDPADTLQAAPPARDPALALAEPLEPQMRVGAIGLGFDEPNDRFVVVLHEVDTETDPDEPGPEPEPADGDAYSLRRDQVRAFVLHATAALAEGRPTCQLCGLPMDPGGHACPATNGHRPTDD